MKVLVGKQTKEERSADLNRGSFFVVNAQLVQGTVDSVLPSCLF